MLVQTKLYRHAQGAGPLADADVEDQAQAIGDGSRSPADGQLAQASFEWGRAGEQADDAAGDHQGDANQHHGDDDCAQAG